MSESKNSTNKTPIYKKWWFWVIIAVFLLAGIGSLGSNQPQTETSESDTNIQESPDSSQPQDSNNSETNKEFLSETDLWRIIMVDTVSKWNDVDEFSLTINENLGGTYQGEYIVIASANYNGPKSGSTDSVLSYCNKIATALDLAKAPVAELMVSWTIPEISNNVSGKCHYHNKDGILVYDGESTGILVNK